MDKLNDAAVAGAGTEEVARKPINDAAASEAVIREVSSWEGVTVHDHRFGGAEFRVRRPQISRKFLA